MKEELFEPLFRKMRVNRILPWIPKNATLCDIGCGFDAQFLKMISPSIKRGYGFDRKVNSKLQGNLTIQSYDLNNPLPLPDNSVDCVTLLAVLEHLSNPITVFAEIRRICRSNGRIILTTPTPLSKPILEFLSFRMGLVSSQEISDHKHYWSLEEIRNLLKQFDFHVVELNTFSIGLNSFAVAEKVTE
ncbi:class I SAM-dependent methyltransferase [Methanospirillum lacunae]|uniref:Class I SAM-dependent methyltransferase n=1 Tax=Methanospirillum lacunae TaxID=668570 RepID=A0A2V2N593_9EURY|nr:class I SAM-dependent methyltransferase [Methanospirillum lacunae]PWR70681.1 class I SAM-dependent methyltransferase [Methanospirillum lacunae]